MKTFVIALLVVLEASAAIAKPKAAPPKKEAPPPAPMFFGLLKDVGQEVKLRQSAAKSKTFKVFGKGHKAGPLCTPQALANTQLLEAFKVNERPDLLVVLCSGERGGEQNRVAVFKKKGKPRSKAITPDPNMNRISDDVLGSAVVELMK